MAAGAIKLRYPLTRTEPKHDIAPSSKPCMAVSGPRRVPEEDRVWWTEIGLLGDRLMSRPK